MKDSKNKAKSIFYEALELTSQESRRAVIERECGEDTALRNQVEQLLKALENPEAERFLEVLPTLVGIQESNSGISEGAGDVIGPYKLLQIIGEGGFGVVFMAEQTVPVRRRVALKVIKPGMDSRNVVARFEAERQALAMMDHPNVAKVFDGGSTASGRPYFVMELVKGIPLTQFCDESRLDTRERLSLFEKICKAIQHAHQNGIIHRDIKPSNVLITLHDGEPVPKIIDFGVSKAIAQQLTEKTMFTQYGQMIGTPAYMSPEQAVYSGLDVDTRSDIYSLGVLLYELLTGTTPLEEDSLRGAAFDELCRRIREEDPPKPSARLSALGDTSVATAALRRSDPKKLGSLIRGELDWIVMKSLEKSRERRYQAASELSSDITRYLNDEPVLACPPSLWYRFYKFSRRNKAALTASALVVAILIIATGVSTGYAFQALEAKNKAIEEADTANAVMDFLMRDMLAQESIRPYIDGDINSDLERKLRFRHTLLDEKKNEDGSTEKNLRNLLEFGLLDASNAINNNMKLSEVINSSRRRISERFANQPKAEATVRLAIGMTLMNLGESQIAEEELHKCLAIRKAQFGLDHPNTLEAKRELGRCYLILGKTQDADELISAAVQSYSQILGNSHVDTLISIKTLFLLRQFQARHEEAKAILDELFKLTKNNDVATADLTAQVLFYKGMVSQKQGQFREAEQFYRESLTIHRQIDESMSTGQIMCNYQLGLLYLSDKKYDEAHAHLNVALNQGERAFESDSPMTSLIKRTLVRTFVAEEDYDAAWRLAETMPDDESTLIAFNEKIDKLSSENQYKKEIAEYREKLELMQSLENKYYALRALEKAVPTEARSENAAWTITIRQNEKGETTFSFHDEDENPVKYPEPPPLPEPR